MPRSRSIVDDVEAGLLEQGRHHVGIARRIGEPGHLLIFGHADDESDSLVSERRIGRKAEQKSN